MSEVGLSMIFKAVITGPRYIYLQEQSVHFPLGPTSAPFFWPLPG